MYQGWFKALEFISAKVYTVPNLIGGWVLMLLVLLLGSGVAGEAGGSSLSSLFDSSSTETKTLLLVISVWSVSSRQGILELKWLSVMLLGIGLEILLSWF